MTPTHVKARRLVAHPPIPSATIKT